MLGKGSLYYRYNPIIQFVLRPVLKLVNANKYPLLGGLVAGVVSLVAHYAIILPFAWDVDLEETLLNIPLVVHVLFLINALTNLLIGVVKKIAQ